MEYYSNITNMDNIFQIGLTSIERGDYYKVNPEMSGKLGAHVVVDNGTKLRGLVSDKGEEIMPCIFDKVNVTLSAFVETTFKGKDYVFNIMAKGYSPRLRYGNYDFNGGTWYYRLEPNKKIENYKNTGKTYAYVELDETTQQLIALLNVKHAVKQEE